MNYNNIHTILTLSFLKGIGPAFFKKNLSFFKTSSTDTSNIPFFIDLAKKKVDDIEVNEASQLSENTIEICEKNNIEIVAINDEKYPKALLEIKDPAPIIFYRGNLNNLKKVLTVIGSREPNDTAAIIAERVSHYFTSNNWSICNGLAEGVDTYAIKEGDVFHKNSIGILGGGINFENSKTLSKKLVFNAEKVLARDGLLISESVPNKKEDTFSVIKSCRIQAALANGLILVQSSLSGGSKYTLKTFSELDRVLGVINPISKDYDNDKYSANKLLVEKGIKGLAELLELKPDKIILKKISILKTRENYSDFEAELLANPIRESLTMF